MLLNLAGGATRDQLAEDAGIAARTVDYHIARIRHMLGLDHYTDLQFRLELRRFVAYIPTLCDR